ncbi:hypothetical protein AGMMS49975_18890 [Clostridia bacterium]|nr:hypothetical protein AGMMS49975_18890 [Clostridia bacterium]
MFRKGSVYRTQGAEWELITKLCDATDFFTGKPCKAALMRVRAGTVGAEVQDGEVLDILYNLRFGKKGGANETNDSNRANGANGTDNANIGNSIPVAQSAAFPVLAYSQMPPQNGGEFEAEVLFEHLGKPYRHYAAQIQAALSPTVKPLKDDTAHDTTHSTQSGEKNGNENAEGYLSVEIVSNPSKTRQNERNDASSKFIRPTGENVVSAAVNALHGIPQSPPNPIKRFAGRLAAKKDVIRDYPKLFIKSQEMKFMRTWKRFAAFATVAVLVVGATPALAANTNMAAKTPTEICGYEPLNPKYPELVKKTDELFGTIVANGKPSGRLYTAWTAGLGKNTYANSPDIPAEKLVPHELAAKPDKYRGDRAGYYEAIVTNPNLQKFIADPKIQSGLKEIALTSFSDLKPSDWFLPYIPLPVYYKVISGVPTDKNGREVYEFQGNRAVTRGEFHAIFGLAQQSESYFDKRTDSSYTLAVQNSGNAWYAKYYNGAMHGLYEGEMQKSDFEAPMTRLEVAWALAAGLGYQSTKYQPKENPFSDLKLTNKVFDSDDYTGVEMVNYEISHIDEGVDSVSYGAILFLNEKGILQGSGGKVNPTQPVTRAELLVLLQNYMKVQGNA